MSDILEPIISLDSVGFVRNERDILANISWTVKRGEHWALMGANGSGKTTLLEIVTGYRWPTSGAVSVLGKVFGKSDLRKLRRSIGYVGSGIEYRLPPTQTALDTVLTGLDSSLRRFTEATNADHAAANSALSRVGMDNFADRTFETLSQGERKRILIARALVRDPALLVLDEPCAGLDPRARDEFLEQVGEYVRAENAPGILLVTHHVEEIAPWINQIHLLANGRTLIQAPPKEALTNAWITKMLGVPCEISKQKDEYRLLIQKN